MTFEDEDINIDPICGFYEKYLVNLEHGKRLGTITLDGCCFGMMALCCCRQIYLKIETEIEKKVFYIGYKGECCVCMKGMFGCCDCECTHYYMVNIYDDQWNDVGNLNMKRHRFGLPNCCPPRYSFELEKQTLTKEEKMLMLSSLVILGERFAINT